MKRVPDRVRALVMHRDRCRCVVCGQSIVNRPGSLHHRKPRGMGGTRQPENPVNLVVLCGTGTTGCHAWIESNRREAYDSGLLVHRWENPTDVPVAVHDAGVVYLADDGTYTPVPHVTKDSA